MPKAVSIVAAALILLSPSGHAAPAESGAESAPGLEAAFASEVRPFLESNCIQCHNEQLATSGVRLDLLDSKLEERTLRLWEVVEHRIRDGSMPPEGIPQPTDEQRRRMVEWTNRALEFARLRPVPKNGAVRRLTVAQHRNTLRELLHLEDDLTAALPPDAVSEDGFVNNAATLDLSPLLMEAYFRVAEEALDRAIVDPTATPEIQRFQVRLGEDLNPDPLPERLILGANSMLLDLDDYVVQQVPPAKPFPFEPVRMRTKYRFHEGYRGNATVRGWREFDSIYHAVFACMRGGRGYPKGSPYETVPEGLLLRPAIPSDEIFRVNGTFGHKANFKVSTRELPKYGRFRVTVRAAKYDDALLLERADPAREGRRAAAVRVPSPEQPQTVELAEAGIYQVDVYEKDPSRPAPAPASSLERGLLGLWSFEDARGSGSVGGVRRVDSPFGSAAKLTGRGDPSEVPSADAPKVGTADFTVAAWVRPSNVGNVGILARGGRVWTHGWYLDTLGNRGVLRLDTTGPDTEPNGTVVSPEGVLRKDRWQHVAAVVRRGEGRARLYVNGYRVAKGSVGPADLDNPDLALQFGAVPDGNRMSGEIDDVRVYGRALDEAEIEALVEPGREFAQPPADKPQDVTVTLGSRKFTAKLEQPALLAARLGTGKLTVGASYSGVKSIDRLVLTRLDRDDEVARRFEAFERRTPRVRAYLGFRRDCGSTFAPVGPAQVVDGSELTEFVFDGAIRDFPSPDVEHGNANYLAGVREIGVRSEYTDGRDMPRLLVRSVEFEGPYYETWPPRSHRSIFVASRNQGDPTAYAREILGGFAAKAFRRPVVAGELATLMRVFEEGFAGGRGFRGSIKDALQVVLTSPQFLFLVESSATPEPEALEDYELASKLSYFLWNGPPDGAALASAAEGRLRDGLDGIVTRMIADARFERFVEEFAAQWLSLDKLDVLEADRELFPDLTFHVRSHLRREPVALLRHLIRNNLPVRHLVDSDFVMANEVVAGYYGLGALTESGLEFAPIRPASGSLGGLLTQAAIMAGLSDGRESNPVKRGAWVARKIVAEPPDPPPPNVPDLEASTEGLPLRERLELHRSQPGCMQCHLKIDPWGVPFEEVDAGGRRKSVPVDARSALPDGTEVAGVDELKKYLAEDRIDQVAFSVLKHLLTYANGRTLAYSEVDYLKRDMLRLRDGGYRMQDMVRYAVRSKLFLEK